MRYLHTMLRVSDLDESLSFFCGVMDMREVKRYTSEAGRFTLVFLAAPGDAEQAKESTSPVLELTYNWDPEEYTGGRNFGHVAFEVDDIYATCRKIADSGVTINRPATGRSHGFPAYAGQHFNRTPAKRRATGATRTLGLGREYRRVVTTSTSD